ncbi:MAG: carboxypeptidase-like regulatory domain-containing protein [Pseudomonadota bacterium]
MRQLRVMLTTLVVLTGGAACSSVHTYSGTVVDGSGVPIERVRVEVMRQAPRPFSEPKRLTTTTADDDGRFSIEVPRRSTYLLIGGWEVDAAEAAGGEYPQIALPGSEDD